MTSQKILFTVMPRGISVDPEKMPVSVYISPRLFGDTEQAKLTEFLDWLNWTRRLQESGMKLTFRCNGPDLTVADFTATVPTEVLRPELWEAIFKKDTLVRSHTFDDYSEHKIVSYSVRNALSLLKGLYQQAGVELALPDAVDRQRQDHRSNYDHLQNLVTGLAVNWEEGMRNRYRDGGKEHLWKQQDPLRRQLRGTDGLFETHQLTELQPVREAATQEFAVFHHLPPGQPIDKNPPDFENLLDFHQVLSSLNSYPELLRAVGLVIDIDLPREFVPITNFGTLSVVEVVPGLGWEILPQIDPLETAYAHVAYDSSRRVFLTLPKPNFAEAVGLLNLNPERFGLAQVDVDGGMHKTIMLAETVQDQRDENENFIAPVEAPHPEVFDPNATLPTLRSGGFSLVADERGQKLLESFIQSKKDFQDTTNRGEKPPYPCFAENLVHGYRIDIWDSHTNQWHSLHRRNALYTLEGETFATTDEEGFNQLAAAQPAPDPKNPPAKDLYLHEAIARWAGWSLSVPFPGKVLSSDPDPEKVLDQSSAEQNVPATPFKMTTQFTLVKGSLPSLRFGRRYRVRARVVDICGNSIKLDHPLLEQLSTLFALPQDLEGFAYLRYEPVIAPQVVLRDSKSVTDPGSQLDRLVIRTFNDDLTKDGDPADLSASDRHILPPRTSVEIAERLGMLDDATGKLNPSPALYNLLSNKDGTELNQVTVRVAGQDQKFPLEAGDRIDSLPYIPDVLARGAALRDLPGTPSHTLSTVRPGVEPDTSMIYSELDDPNPRLGSATLTSFGGEGDWQTLQPFRLALADGEAVPRWDAANRVLTVSLPKGTSAVVPLSSYFHSDDLKLMGIWQWLREYIDQKTIVSPDNSSFDPRQKVDRIAHILQRALEGGHWMLTPPQLLTLVHAVQQPIGTPAFTAISVQHEPDDELNPDANRLQTVPEVGIFRNSRYSTAPNSTELNPITAWRKPGSTDVYLLGGLKIHGASTSKVEILAKWADPIDDLTVERLSFETLKDLNRHAVAPVDEVPLNQLKTHFIPVTSGERYVGYYAAEKDLLCFVKQGDRLGNLGDLVDFDRGYSEETFPDKDGVRAYSDAAPRHLLNDTKHHRIYYTARATSRYQEYFQPVDKVGNERNFTRSSAEVVVDVPASARPIAPQIAYVIPTFGWQRQTQTNLKRSVRFGGGLRVYLERPWFSSGEGELLGVTLYRYSSQENINNPEVRDRWKSSITQWGNDPIWQTQGLYSTPSSDHFPDAIAQEDSLSLEEDASKRVDVVGYPVAFDQDRQKWYCDLTIDAHQTYSPFVRLALVRYQPCALADAKLSRVVLADFAQLTSDRAAVVTADPYHPRQLQVTISGVKPSAPLPQIVPTPTEQVISPTQVEVEVQQYDNNIGGDLAWIPVDSSIATVQERTRFPANPLVLWACAVTFTELPTPGQFRLLIREYEYISAEYTVNSDGTTNPALLSDLTTETRIVGSAPRRLVYAEVIAIDDVLISQAPSETRQTQLDLF